MLNIETTWTTGTPRLAVDHCGTGELVLCLHGIGGNKRNWHCNFAAFAPHFHIAAWDARGYGESEGYPGALDFDELATDITRVLDHFGVRKVHLLGLSMGGRIAMEFARLFPHRLLSLTLCATNEGFHAFTDAERVAFVESRKAPLLAGKTPRDIAPAVARSLVSADSTVSALDQMVDSMERLHAESYIKAIEALVALPRCSSLETISVPVHIVCGEKDPLTTPDQSRDLAARISHARLTFIPLAGHLVNLEQHDTFDRCVLNFLLSI